MDLYSPPARLASNRLLDALPESDRQRLQPLLTREKMAFKKELGRPGDHVDNVYFMLSGVASMVALASESPSVEVATIGNEGLVGVSVFLGTDVSAMHTFMQIPGEALRLSADDFRQALQDSPALHAIIGRYVQGLITQIAQAGACNRMHTIEERCARWLLMTHDRVNTDEFPLTQEFLGQMLGVRRASVSLVAGLLQKAGYIHYSRGLISVLDRPGLETAACDCYHIIRNEFDRLLSVPAMAAAPV